MLLKAGTIKRLHVNQHTLRANRKDGGKRPVFTIQTSKGPVYGSQVKIKGQMEFVYSPKKPLKCGATLWGVTKAAIEIT